MGRGESLILEIYLLLEIQSHQELTPVSLWVQTTGKQPKLGGGIWILLDSVGSNIGKKTKDWRHTEYRWDPIEKWESRAQVTKIKINKNKQKKTKAHEGICHSLSLPLYCCLVAHPLNTYLLSFLCMLALVLVAREWGVVVKMWAEAALVTLAYLWVTSVC